MAAARAAISPFLDRDSVRARVAAHLAAGRPVEELGIEPNRPQDLRDFAFVGLAPKRAGPHSRYRCSFCQTDQKFKSGRIVLSSDGSLRLIGDDCWKHHLDEERYNKEAQDYKDYLTRQRFNRLRDRFDPAIRTAAQQLRVLILSSHDDIGFVDELPGLLERHAPALFAQLAEARRAGGQLRVERIVRDYSAIERSGSDRSVMQLETLHLVAGLDVAVGPAGNLNQRLRDSVRNLNAVIQAIATVAWETLTNAAAVRQINAIEQNVRVAVRLVDEISAAVAKACDFFQPGNIAGIARWCADHDCELQLSNAILMPRNDGFLFRIDERLPCEIRRPESLTRTLLPDLLPLKRLLQTG